MANTLQRWFDNRSLSPFRNFSQIEDPLERLVSDLLDMRKIKGMSSLDFSPSCEVSEDEGSYSMKFDLPGVSKENVKVEVENNKITVSAERTEEKNKDTKKTHLSEISYGSYQRSLSLPTAVNEKTIEAKFQDGVLTLTVPKTKSPAAKQIPIH